MYSKSVLALAALLTAALWFGCDDDPGPCADCPGPRPDIESLQIATIEAPNDTFWYFDEDSAAIRVIVIATGYDGLVVPGVQVDIGLSNAQLGYVEFTDPELRDTTDATGRVNILYHSYATAGTQIITASAGGRTASRTLTLVEVERPEGFILHSDRPHDTVYVAPDSLLEIHFSAAFIDGDGNPRPEFDGMFISSSATGGILERFSVIANGQTTSTWTFHNEYGPFQARIFGMTLDPFTILPDTTG